MQNLHELLSTIFCPKPRLARYLQHQFLLRCPLASCCPFTDCPMCPSHNSSQFLASRTSGKSAKSDAADPVAAVHAQKRKYKNGL